MSDQVRNQYVGFLMTRLIFKKFYNEVCSLDVGFPSGFIKQHQSIGFIMQWLIKRYIEPFNLLFTVAKKVKLLWKIEFTVHLEL